MAFVGVRKHYRFCGSEEALQISYRTTNHILCESQQAWDRWVNCTIFAQKWADPKLYLLLLVQFSN